MILVQRHARLGTALLGLGLVCASFAHATNYYVDCNYGSNGNSGTSPQLAWRTLLQVGISSFQAGDTINLLRDCTWNETLTPPSSGSSGSVIKINSYGNGLPPHLTGYLPIAARWWTQAGSTNVWSATLYSTTSGLANVVQCGVRGFYCLTQPPSQLQYVRFGTTGERHRSARPLLVRTATSGTTPRTIFCMCTAPAAIQDHITPQLRQSCSVEKPC